MAMDINSPADIAACAVRTDHDASWFGERQSQLLVISITAGREPRMLTSCHLQPR